MHWLSEWSGSEPGCLESVEWPGNFAEGCLDSCVSDAQYIHIVRFRWLQHSRLHVRCATACQLEHLPLETGLQHHPERGSPAFLSRQSARRQDAAGCGIPGTSFGPSACE